MILLPAIPPKIPRETIPDRISHEKGGTEFVPSVTSKLLSCDRLLEYISMRGFFVLGISKEDLREFATIREMLESAIFEDFLANASEEYLEEAKRYTKRKIALVQTGMTAESLPETKATFDCIYEYTPYHHMVSILQTYQEYVDLMIALAIDTPEDVAKTIKNSTLLLQVFETRDYELAKKWLRIRYENAVYKIENSSIYYSRGTTSMYSTTV